MFIWDFQSSFRRSVETALHDSLEALGVTVEPTVFLIGVLREDRSGRQLSVEPQDGPIVPGDFAGLHDRAAELYHQDLDSQLTFTAEWLQEKRKQEAMQRAYVTAISEVLEATLGPGLRFFVGLPTPVDQHSVFIATGLPEWVLDDTAHLSSKVAADRHPVGQSLVLGAVGEVLRLSRRVLYEPYPGAGADIGVDPADVARAAARALTRSAVILSGNEMWPDLFDGMNRLATHAV